MKRRPRSITIISWFFLIFGSVALLSGLLPISNLSVEHLKGHWMVHLARLVSIVAGLFMLRGHNWARWLVVSWIAFHVVLSALHSVLQLLIHVAIFGVILFFLFRRPANAYFSGIHSMDQRAKRV